MQKWRLEPRPRAAALDSASSLNSARGARSRPLSARRRNSLAGLDLGAILLSPDKAACLATSSCKVSQTAQTDNNLYASHADESGAPGIDMMESTMPLEAVTVICTLCGCSEVSGMLGPHARFCL